MTWWRRLFRDRSPTCAEIRPLLSAFLDDQVTPAERARVTAHLTGCPRCQEDLATLRATVTALRALPTIPVPPALARRLAQTRPAPPARPLVPALQRASLATAALTVLLLLANGLLSPGPAATDLARPAAAPALPAPAPARPVEPGPEVAPAARALTAPTPRPAVGAPAAPAGEQSLSPARPADTQTVPAPAPPPAEPAWPERLLRPSPLRTLALVALLTSLLSGAAGLLLGRRRSAG